MREGEGEGVSFLGKLFLVRTCLANKLINISLNDRHQEWMWKLEFRYRQQQPVAMSLVQRVKSRYLISSLGMMALEAKTLPALHLYIV